MRPGYPQALVHLSNNHSATDLRDKVYVVLGIMEKLGNDHPIEVNYEISMQSLHVSDGVSLQHVKDAQISQYG